MAVALDALCHEGIAVEEADKDRLSPLGSHHINIVGRYSFNLPEAIEHGALRPLLKANDE